MALSLFISVGSEERFWTAVRVRRGGGGGAERLMNVCHGTIPRAPKSVSTAILIAAHALFARLADRGGRAGRSAQMF